MIRSGPSSTSSETDDDDVEYVSGSYPTMSVLPLNRFIFKGNVVQCLGQHTDHWIVQFCPNWYGPCQKFLPMFKNTSVQWQEKLNSDIVLRSRARFAEVDCATDKELCNDQLVDSYPTVVHYFGGQRVSRWTADRESEFKGLDRWVQEELRSAKEPPLGRLKTAKQKTEEVTASTGEMSWLSIAMFLVTISGPIVIVLKGAGLAPRNLVLPSAATLRPPAAQKLMEEEPGSPCAAVAIDGGVADSSVSQFMPDEWVQEIRRTRSSSLSMEL